jgi:glycerophosphoryl diester phosphodiesterase
MAGLDWLTVRPIAHRGLHDARQGVIENTPAAFSAAIAGEYGIECDLQVSADGEAMVHHDDVLGRLTEGSGRLDRYTAAELVRVPFKDTTDHMITLGDLCDLVDGRVTLVIELKSRFDDDRRLVRRAADVLARYRGRAALMSFDPAQVAAVRALAPAVPRGMVAERHYREWDAMPTGQRRALGRFQHVWRTRPQFIAYWVRDLPAPVPWIARWIFGLPLLTWTVRNASDRAYAARHADQIIFEGFRP